MIKQPNTIDKIVARRLRDARIRCGLSQKDAASRIHLTYQQLQKYENCYNRITAGRLWQFSVIYNVPIQNFFTNSEEI